MSRARIFELMALKQNISLQAYRREAARLNEEIDRLEKRRAQIIELDAGYRDHLKIPELRASEYSDVLQIIGKLRERRDLDDARLDILLVERDRLTKILAEKKRKIERLEEEARLVKMAERQELEERSAALLPARRK